MAGGDTVGPWSWRLCYLEDPGEDSQPLCTSFLFSLKEIENLLSLISRYLIYAIRQGTDNAYPLVKVRMLLEFIENQNSAGDHSEGRRKLNR